MLRGAFNRRIGLMASELEGWEGSVTFVYTAGMSRLNPWRWLAPALLAVAVAPAPGVTAERDGAARYTLEVPAGEWKTARLRRLPKGTELQLRVDAERSFGVAVFGSLSEGGGPDLQAPLIQGGSQIGLTLRFTVPRDDDYYVGVSNPTEAAQVMRIGFQAFVSSP